MVNICDLRRFFGKKGHLVLLGGICVISIATCAQASIFSNLFGFSAKYEKKITDLKNSVNKQMSDNRLEVVGLKSRIDKVELNVSAIAQGTANTEAKISGIDRSVKDIKNISSGRDTITKQVNDTKLMKSIFSGIISICLAIIAFMKARLSALSKRNVYLVDSRIKYQNLWLMKLDPEFAKIKKEMENKKCEK